jgi:hypothetical protein
VSFAAITLHVASQQVFVVVSLYFVIDSVRKVLDTHSYNTEDHFYTLLVNFNHNISWIWTFHTIKLKYTRACVLLYHS